MTDAITDLTLPAKRARESVAAGMALGAIAYAATRGADRLDLLSRVGLQDGALPDPDAHVPLPRYVAMLRAAAQQCGDPAFALHFAEATNFAELSIVGLIGYASETMAEALVQMNRYGRLVLALDTGGADRFLLSRENGALWLIDQRRNAAATPEITETTFARMVTGTKQFCPLPYATLVEVMHPDPGYAAEYERILGAPVRFGAARNAMRITEESQSYRISLYPRYAFGVFCAHADALIQTRGEPGSWPEAVRQAILPVLHSGAATMETVAATLRVSPQTLYRRLKDDGAQFDAIVNALRHDLALGYVRAGKASLKEVAYLLGFADVASFSRAFKRWTGKSPGAFRLGCRTSNI
jgi:AraC-like DNA-binding protein